MSGADFYPSVELSPEQERRVDAMIANLPRNTFIDMRGTAELREGVLIDMNAMGRSHSVRVAWRALAEADESIKLLSDGRLPLIERALLVITARGGANEKLVGELGEARPGMRPGDREGDHQLFVTAFKTQRKVA
jgi:hypothetical protein